MLLGYAYALGRGDEAMPADATSALGIIAGGIHAFANARMPADDAQIAQAIATLQRMDVLPQLPPVI